MNALSQTRAGGDRDGNPCKLRSSVSIDTAGAPAFNDDLVTPPEWIELIPAGSFHGRDGRGPYRLDDPAAVIAATMELRMRAGVPIDYDHATDLAAPLGGPAPAAGWITEFAVRSGAIWGRVEWTARAADAIRAREYRYISPVFQFSAEEGRVTKLLRAGLTNNPNLYLTAISAAGDEDGKMDELLNKLREILGLEPDADPAEILEQVAALAAEQSADGQSTHRAATPDPARYVAVAEFERALTELNTLKTLQARERAERKVDEAIRAGKLVPAQREWAVTYCSADPRGFGAFSARQPAVLAGEMNLGGDPRATTQARGDARLLLSGTETAICSLLGVAPRDFLERRNAGADFLRINKDNSEQNL
jgi:phage I-like protein